MELQKTLAGNPVFTEHCNKSVDYFDNLYKDNVSWKSLRNNNKYFWINEKTYKVVELVGDMLRLTECKCHISFKEELKSLF